MNHAIYAQLCNSSNPDTSFRAFCVGECGLPAGTMGAVPRGLWEGFDEDERNRRLLNQKISRKRAKRYARQRGGV